MDLRLAPLFLLLLLFSQAHAGFKDYTPKIVDCPTGSLIRPAIGLSPSENEYRMKRKARADRALKDWLLRIDPDFASIIRDVPVLPTVCLFTGIIGLKC